MAFVNINFDFSSDIPSLIVDICGLIAVIYVFKQESIRHTESEEKSTKVNLFLSTIVQPNIQQILSYYKIVDSLLTNELIIINSLTVPKDIYSAKQNSLRKLKNINKRYIDDNISLVRSYDPSLATELQNIINVTIDLFTITIDNPSSYSTSISYQIISQKEAFISKLFEEIRPRNVIKKKTFLDFIFRKK